MSERIYVVAGNYQQFQHYKNNKIKALIESGVEIKSNHFVYVSNPDMLRGLRECHGFYIGTYYDRKDLEEINLNIRLANTR